MFPDFFTLTLFVASAVLSSVTAMVIGLNFIGINLKTHGSKQDSGYLSPSGVGIHAQTPRPESCSKNSTDAPGPVLHTQNIDSEEKKVLARLKANFYSRQMTAEEKTKWINSLAQIYRAQGLKIEGEKKKHRKWPFGSSPGPNQIVKRIVETSGLSERTVMIYLHPEFKNRSYQRVKDKNSGTGIGDREIVSKAKGSTRKGEMLLTKYFCDLKKCGNDLSALIQKAYILSGKMQDNFCQNTIEEYRPRITQILGSIERLYPHTKEIEYTEYLKDNFQYSEEEQVDVDVFSDIATSLSGLIETLEADLAKRQNADAQKQISLPSEAESIQGEPPSEPGQETTEPLQETPTEIDEHENADTFQDVQVLLQEPKPIEPEVLQEAPRKKRHSIFVIRSS